MSCALTQGYVIDCRSGMGGIKEVYLMAKQDVASITEVDGVVTALTKDAGKRFYKYELEKATASLTENFNISVQNGTQFFSPELSVVLNKLQANTRNEILLLAKNTLVAVVKDNNGKYWLVGKERGIELTAGSAATGVAEGDRGGYTLTFTGAEPELAPEVSSSLIASLETAGS